MSARHREPLTASGWQIYEASVWLDGRGDRWYRGKADRILPPEASSRRQAKMIKNARFVELKGGLHGVQWSHAEQINSELVKFLA